MTTESNMPNPVEMFQMASGWAKGKVAGVRQDQLDGPTPCADWNVITLINHVIGGAELTSGGMLGAAPDIGVGKPQSSYAGERDASKLSSAYVLEVEKVTQAAGAPGAMQAEIPTPFGNMPAGQLLAGTAMDHLIHGWDLAKATGQDTSMDPELVEMFYGIVVPGFADQGREIGIVGPAIEVQDDAGKQVMMLAYMGRRP